MTRRRRIASCPSMHLVQTVSSTSTEYAGMQVRSRRTGGPATSLDARTSKAHRADPAITPDLRKSSDLSDAMHEVVDPDDRLFDRRKHIQAFCRFRVEGVPMIARNDERRP